MKSRVDDGASRAPDGFVIAAADDFTFRDALTYSLRLEALVLDYPTNEAAAGVIYVDDLEAVEE